MTRSPGPHPDDQLPLRPAVFAVLMALQSGERAGYDILRTVNQATGGRTIVGPGTLYRILKEMRESALVDYAPRPASEPDDDRRQYYRCTAFGNRVAKSEASRISALLRTGQFTDVLKPKRT